MSPTIALKKLLGAVGSVWFAIPLAAQMPPMAHENPGSAAESHGPIAAIHAHLCGFHFYSGDLKRAVRVDHYCSHLNEDVLQCVIYDSAEKHARLIGVEYIISETLFRQLPEEEQKLWHSHRYEVMSGLLSAPDISDEAEKELMKTFVSTYGKTWNLWQVDRGDKLPLGLPKLMMGFTADGQLDPKLLADRDRALTIDSAQLKAKRADIPTRPIAAGADAWQHGPAFQISDEPPRQIPSAPPVTVTPTSSYMPVKIEEPFAAIRQNMERSKSGIMHAHQALLAERYDLADRPAAGVTMTRGKPLQQGVRVRLKPGLTWEKLGRLTPGEIRAQDLFPAGFQPLPHPNHPEGGMLFPHFVIEELNRQEQRDLTRFDLDFDLPDHFLPEFPGPIFLTTRPDLGDVSQGQAVTLGNY